MCVFSMTLVIWSCHPGLALCFNYRVPGGMRVPSGDALTQNNNVYCLLDAA